MHPVIIGAPRRHWALMGLAAGALAAIGGVLIGLRVSAAGWIMLVACGSAALFGAWQFYDARPRVVIDDRGVLDRTFAIGVIPWSDITDVHLKRVHGRVQLCLDLRNTKAYTTRLPSALQPMVSLNRQLGLTDLSVDLDGLATDPVELETLLRDRLKNDAG